MAPRNLASLDVASPYLVHVSNVDSKVNWRKLKDVIGKAAGKVVFVETFEAWFDKKIGHAVIQFINADSARKFMRLPNEWFESHFEGIPLVTILQGEQDRYKFFNKIFTEIGVNLLECEGKPPASWVDQVKFNREQRRKKGLPSQTRSIRPERREDNRHGQTLQRDNTRYRPYNRRQNVTDANLRSMPSHLLHGSSLGPRQHPYESNQNNGPWIAGHPPAAAPSLGPYYLRPRYDLAPPGQRLSMASYEFIGGPHYNAL